MKPRSISSYATVGVEALPVTVTARPCPNGALHIVGAPDRLAREMRVRVRSALQIIGIDAAQGFTVHIDGPDEATEVFGEDVAVAAAILAVLDRLPPELSAACIIGGELGLDGDLRARRGAVCAAQLAQRANMRALLLPPASAAAAVLEDGATVYSAVNIGDVAAGRLTTATAPLEGGAGRDHTADFEDVAANMTVARRALEIAVIGHHNVLLVGPPGIGKTMLARRVPTILPPLSSTEQLEVRAVYSAVGLPLPHGAPFRAPHHTISEAALLGGGRPIRPGELSLAHRGVLFLDEIDEFRRSHIEALRAALRERQVVRRGRHQIVRLPGDALIVASATPCPCGWRDSAERRCACSEPAVRRHAARLADLTHTLFDLQVRVESVSYADLDAGARTEASASIRGRVLEARQRLGSVQARATHATLGSLDPETGARVERVAASIAALGGKTAIDDESVAEAIRFRNPRPSAAGSAS